MLDNITAISSTQNASLQEITSAAESLSDLLGAFPLDTRVLVDTASTTSPAAVSNGSIADVLRATITNVGIALAAKAAVNDSTPLTIVQHATQTTTRPSLPMPSHPISSHLTLAHPVSSRPILAHAISSHLTPAHPGSSRLILTHSDPS